MKTFKGHKQETLLLIEESDLDDKIASRLYVVFLLVGFTGVKYYITHERIT